MLSLDNAYNEDELRAFDERVRKGGRPRRRAGRVRRRAEDRRPQHRAHLRGRPAGARRDARRRRARRGRDRERAHDPGDPAARCAARPPGAIEVRGEVYLPRAAFERINREREEAGEPLFANPRNAAAGTMRNLDPALVATARAGGVHLSGRRRRTPANADCPPTPRAMLDGDARWGLPVEPHWQRCAGIDEVIAFCRDGPTSAATLEFDTDGVVIKVDDLALRERLGHDRQVSALGDRLQVSRRAGARRGCSRSTSTSAAPARSRRTPCSSRCSSPARRSRWRRCTTPRTSRARTSAKATRSSSRRPATSSRGSSRRSSACGRRSRQPWVMPDDVPRRAAARCTATKKRSSGAARTPRVRRGSAAASSTSPRAAR